LELTLHCGTIIIRGMIATWRMPSMSRIVAIELEWPDDRARLRLPPGVHARLQELLDRQDAGIPLSEAERREAEGLVELAEFLALLRLRAERAAEKGPTEGDDDREWERRTAEEFGRGYADTDAIYDERSTR
jgi:hypothetical protein